MIMDLNEFDKDEWFDVMRVIKPDLDREEYEKIWAEFQLDKARKKLQ